MVWSLGNPYRKKGYKYGSGWEYTDVYGNSNINLSNLNIKRRKKRQRGYDPGYHAKLRQLGYSGYSGFTG